MSSTRRDDRHDHKDESRIKREDREDRERDKDKDRDKQGNREKRESDRDRDRERDGDRDRGYNRNNNYNSRDNNGRGSYGDKIKSEFERDRRKRSRSPTSPRGGRHEKYEKREDRGDRGERGDRGDRGYQKRSNDRRSSPPPTTEEVWGKREKVDGKKEEQVEKEEPNFEPSGLLNQEAMTVNGVVLKYDEPIESRKPKVKWLLYPFKDEKSLDPIPVHRNSSYLFGRERAICDIPIDHPSCSKQHSVLQFREVEKNGKKRVLPYIVDLESTNGTFLNGTRVDPAQYWELREKDVLKFGFSSREYVLLHEGSGLAQDSDSDEA